MDIMKHIENEQTVLSFLSKINLFADLDRESLRWVLKCFEKISFEKDQIIIREGDLGKEMYIIIQGEVSVLKDLGWGQRELMRRKSGEIFGEMALILDVKRTATIQTVEYTECFILKRHDFNNLLDKNVKIARCFLRILTDRLKQSDERSSVELVQAQKAMIFALADLADSRDPETGAHLKRVRKYCALLSEHLSLHPHFKDQIYPEFIESIHFTSPLHDIGKVAIPDGILLKPGKLNDKEYEIMKTHSAIGAKTLKEVAVQCNQKTFLMAYHIARHHHERWDGKGYPDGIAGETIPLEARIMAVSDVFDALLSRRVYKPPMHYEKAGKILYDGIKTQFDPIIVEVMLRHIKEFDGVHKQNSD